MNKKIERLLFKKIHSGIFGFTDYGLFLLRNIQNIIVKTMFNIDFQEVMLPILLNSDLFLKSGRSQDFMSEMFNIKKENLSLSPTCEESALLFIEPVYEKDLPRKIFQISRKFRNELRPRYNILRGKEFIMKDGYSFHLSSKDLNSTYLEVKAAYLRFFKILELNNDVINISLSKDDNMLSDYSEEFLIKFHTGSSKIGFCPRCKLYFDINKEEHDHEIIDIFNCIEIGHIFKLLTHFSKTLKVKTYHQKKEIFMGCYGIGISRLLYVMMNKFFDKKNNHWNLPQSISFSSLNIIIDHDIVLNQNIKNFVKDFRKNNWFININHHNHNLTDKIKESRYQGFNWMLIYKRKIQQYVLENREKKFIFSNLKEIKNFLKIEENKYFEQLF